MGTLSRREQKLAKKKGDSETELFAGFNQFEESLEVRSDGPVSGVAIRYDNPGGTVFAATPVVIIPGT